MSFKIEQGLFSSEFTDHHAILGVPVDANPKDIRKRYLKIARLLHPDSSTSHSEGDRHLASELLSKLVNPAYEKLSQERNYAEYSVLLRLKGQQAARQQETVMLVSDIARQLASNPNVEQAYRIALKELAEQQYDVLPTVIDTIGQISELNLVYLMRSDTTGTSTGNTAIGSQSAADARAGKPSGQTADRATQPASGGSRAAAPPQKESPVDGYLRRAQEFERKQDYARVIIELREALHIDPKNSTCHSRLGVVYFKTNQPTMAKIHFNQALKLNPQDPTALEGKKRLEKKSADMEQGQQRSSDKGGRPDKSGGGLFGLFGGKKK